MSKENEAFAQQAPRADLPHMAGPGPSMYPTYSTVPAPVGNHVVMPEPYRARQKSVVEAYLLWFVFGLLGFHHFYLNRPAFGVLYFFTFGLFGVGFLIDLFRMPYLVRESNRCLDEPSHSNKKNISDAYTLWFPFGLLGFHHFYLGRSGFGVLYFFTFGLFGIGWLIDLCRIPSLVRQANERRPEDMQKKQLGVSYIVGVSPLGILGVHHFYLNRPICGIYYFLTFGGVGIGWIVDWFRMPVLVKRANKNILEEPDNLRHLDDAYIAWMPFGLIGLHHYYMNRPVWGLLYTFTFGLCGIGWLVDGCRMHCLVKDCNRLLKERRTPCLYSGPRRGYVISTGVPNENTPYTVSNSNTGFTGQGLHPAPPQYQQQHPQQYQQVYPHQQQQYQQQQQQQLQQQQYPPQQQPEGLPGYQETTIPAPSYMEKPPPYSAS